MIQRAPTPASFPVSHPIGVWIPELLPPGPPEPNASGFEA